MALSFGARVFRPARLPTLGVVLLLPLLIGLGFWQLDRADQKRELLAQFEVDAETTLTLNRAHEVDANALRYRNVSVTGRYDSAHQFLLDNMTHAGRVGYHVLTPLRFHDAPRAVIVNRGWVPAGASRDELPALPVEPHLREVRGRINLPPRPGLRLGQPAAGNGDWPQVLHYPTSDTLEARLGYPLEDFFVLLAPDEPDGFVREWRPDVPGPATHIGYAVQWFALALALLIIYVAVNLEEPDADGRP